MVTNSCFLFGLIGQPREDVTNLKSIQTPDSLTAEFCGEIPFLSRHRVDVFHTDGRLVSDMTKSVFDPSMIAADQTLVKKMYLQSSRP
jgi:hypothetical protein